MTPLGLIVLRRTATLVHAIPELRARLTHDGRHLLEVARPSHPAQAPQGRWLAPCAFRLAVGRAVDAVKNGKTLAVLGLDSGTDPVVEFGAPAGVLLPGGMVHIADVSGSELAFATTCNSHLVEAIARTQRIDVRCHPDPVTATTLVVKTLPAAALPASTLPTSTVPASIVPDEFAAALDDMRTLLARTAVRELTDDLDAFLRTEPDAADVTLRQRGSRASHDPTPGHEA